MREQRLRVLIDECDELIGQMATLVEIGHSVPSGELQALLYRGQQLHAQMQTHLRLAVEAN